MSRSKDKDILVEADPEPERTLKRKLREAKRQQSRDNHTGIFEQEEEMAAKNNNRDPFYHNIEVPLLLVEEERE